MNIESASLSFTVSRQSMLDILPADSYHVWSGGRGGEALLVAEIVDPTEIGKLATNLQQ